VLVVLVAHSTVAMVQVLEVPMVGTRCLAPSLQLVVEVAQEGNNPLIVVALVAVAVISVARLAVTLAVLVQPIRVEQVVMVAMALNMVAEVVVRIRLAQTQMGLAVMVAQVSQYQ
jgi:hypothetical protein